MAAISMAAAAGADLCKAETTHASAPASPATAAPGPAAPSPPPPHAMVLESAESQVQRAAARQAAAEACLRDLSTKEGEEATSRAYDEAEAAVEAARRREAAVRAERAAVAARADANAAEKKRLVAALAAAERRLLVLASAGADTESSAGKEMASVKHKRGQLQAELDLVRAEGEVLRATLSGMDRVVAAAWEVGHKARMAYEDALVSCVEAREAAANLARVHALCKENNTTGTVAVVAAVAGGAPSSSNDDREPRRQVPVVVRLLSLVQPSRRQADNGPRRSDEDAPCPVCDRWFFCGDTLLAYCECTYHLHCAALWFGQGGQKRCCRSECGCLMHPAWLAAWGQGWDWDDEGAALELDLEEQIREWRKEARSRLSSSTASPGLQLGEEGGAATAAEARSSAAPASPSHDVDVDSASSPDREPDRRTNPESLQSDHKPAQAPHSDDCLIATDPEEEQEGAGPKPCVPVPLP